MGGGSTIGEKYPLRKRIARVESILFCLEDEHALENKMFDKYYYFDRRYYFASTRSYFQSIEELYCEHRIKWADVRSMVVELGSEKCAEYLVKNPRAHSKSSKTVTRGDCKLLPV